MARDIIPPEIDFWSHTSKSMYERIVQYYAKAKPVSWVFNGKYRQMAKAVAYVVADHRKSFSEAMKDIAKATGASS